MRAMGAPCHLTSVKAGLEKLWFSLGAPKGQENTHMHTQTHICTILLVREIVDAVWLISADFLVRRGRSVHDHTLVTLKGWSLAWQLESHLWTSQPPIQTTNSFREPHWPGHMPFLLKTNLRLSASRLVVGNGSGLGGGFPCINTPKPSIHITK